MDAFESVSKSALMVLLLCASVAGQVAIQGPSDPQRGRVSGLVEDEHGQLLAGATVKATTIGVTLAAALPNTRTDTQGRFALSGLVPGKMYLHASKEDAFYPDTSFNLWNRGQGSAEVDVPAGGEIAGILIKVSPAARLNVKAIDFVTGATIVSFGVRIERDGSPERFMSAGNIKNTYLVPADPIRFRVEARGHEPAWYSEGNSDGQPSSLRLAPRQELSVTISLRPVTR